MRSSSGRRDGTFRTDWQLTLHFAIVHGADEHAANHDIDRTQALRLLNDPDRAVFQGTPGPRRAVGASRYAMIWALNV